MIRAQADIAAIVPTSYAHVAAVAMLPNIRYMEADGFAEARRWIPVLRGDLVYRAPVVRETDDDWFSRLYGDSGELR